MTNLSLTEEQQKAVEHIEGPLLIVAGPGSGKTRVLVERVVQLIQKCNVDPEKIFVTTFTEKAAEELKARISKGIGSKVESMQISTIHSFCYDILKEYSDYHDLGATFDVLDNESQLMFLRSNFYRLGLQNWTRISDVSTVITFFNKCSENCIDPNDLINAIKNEYPNEENFIGFCKAYKKYLEILEEDHKIDFPGLQKSLLYLLEKNSEALADIRDRFDFILVDEYQDTNPIQDRIFELISKPKCNICIVGDEDQSIYAFRGADPCNFKRFPKKFNNTIRITLDKNFRSTSNIINLSDRFMEKFRYYKKEIKPCRGRGNNILLLNSSDVHDEAKNVVKIIKKLKDEKIIPHYGYVALLFRSVKNHAPNIIKELKDNNIPYTVSGDGGFLKRVEIRTVLYLMSYVDPPDYGGKFKNRWGKWWDISLFGNEFLKLNQDTMESLKNLDKNFDISSLVSKKEFKDIKIANKEDISKLIALNKLKMELMNEEKDMLDIFYELLKISGYLNWLLEEGNEESQMKLFNLAKLSSIMNKYESLSKKPKIQDFMWYLYLLPRNMQYDEEILDNPRSVKILTVHQAKGLEFPVVFICSVIKNRFPSKKFKSYDLVPIPEKLLMSKINESENEERRLFYVAMTRAQDNLIISTTDKINVQKVGYSPFIEEIKKIGDFTYNCDELVKNCQERDLERKPTVNLSYSSIDTYNECPFRYKMIYNYGFEFPSSYMQNYGIILHNCLHKLHIAMKNNENIDDKKIEHIVNRCWIKLHNTKKKDENVKNGLEKRLMKYYSHINDYISQIVSTEEPFSISTNDAVISGRTDLIIKNKEGNIELLDFKAREEAGVTETSVGFQLKLYELALQDKYKFDKIGAYTFKDNKRVYFETGNTEKLEAQLETICENINNEKFEPQENKFCSLCVFKFCC